MRVFLLPIFALSAIPLAACDRSSTTTGNDATSPAPPAAQSRADDPAPAPAAPTLTPEAEHSETGARDVLLDFARAIELGRYGEAWALLSAADQGKWSEEGFATLFDDLSDVTVAVPAGSVEGAAGSLFYTAPVTVTGNDRDGRPVRLQGEAVLRRVNDVDGASAAQLRWHFETLTLDWVH